jgi:hypothetical protein
VKWEYLVNMILMPNGDTESGLKKAAELFYNNISYYPYCTYINWQPKDEGNVLDNDSRFCYLLYKWNNDTFKDFEKTRDAGRETKNLIYNFIAFYNRFHNKEELSPSRYKVAQGCFLKIVAGHSSLISPFKVRATAFALVIAGTMQNNSYRSIAKRKRTVQW